MARQGLALVLPVLLASWPCGGEGRLPAQEERAAAAGVFPAEQAAPGFAEPERAGACDPADPATSCLAPRRRFKVQVARKTPKGTVIPGLALPLTGLTRLAGAWSFFVPDSPDVVVKVIDGRTVNGFFWVFYAGLTEAQYEIVVSDTLTGRQRSYHGLRGKLASAADQMAFKDLAPAAPSGAADAGVEPESSVFCDFQPSTFTPVVGEAVTFTLDPGCDTSGESICWEFELPGCLGGRPCKVPASGPCDVTDTRTATHAYSHPLPYTVRLTLGSTAGGHATSKTVVVSGCEYQVSLLDPGPFKPAGDSGRVAITTSPGCTWNAASDVNWITIPSSGSGPAKVRFQVGPNHATKPREGHLIIADKPPLLVRQEGDLHRPCVADGNTLCLAGGRFEVQVDTATFGSALAVPISDDSGYFGFLDTTNVELVTTVVDPTAQSGHFSIYFGALTNIPYKITVRDRVKGIFKTYDNGDGDFVSQKDTSSF